MPQPSRGQHHCILIPALRLAADATARFLVSSMPMLPDLADIYHMHSRPGVAALQTAQDKLDESRAALERKSQLYDRLAAGQYDDADELYNVNFLHKSSLEEEQHSLQHEAVAHGHHARSEAPIDTAAGLLSSAGRPLPFSALSPSRSRHALWH